MPWHYLCLMPYAFQAHPHLRLRRTGLSHSGGRQTAPLAVQRGALGSTLFQRVEGGVERLESERSRLDAPLAEPDLRPPEEDVRQAMKAFEPDEVEVRAVMKRWEPAAKRLGEVT